MLKKFYKTFIVFVTTLVVLGSLQIAINEIPVAQAACGGGYLMCETVTALAAQAGSTDSTNFPLLVATSTQTSLATVANGGLVQNTTTQTGSSYTGTVPADLIFTSDSACGTKLNWEVESYSATTGALIAWVQLPTLSHTTNTVIELCWDNSSVSSFQGNVHGTWDGTFTAVYHLPNGSTLNTNDSTTNSVNLTNNNSATAVAGQIDGAVNLSAASSQYLSSSSGLQTSAMSYEVWVKPASFPNAYNTVMSTDGSTSQFFDMHVKSNGKLALYLATSGGTADYDGTGTNTLSAGTTYMLVMTYVTSTGLVGYVNGAVDGNTTFNGTISTGGTTLNIGNNLPNFGGRYFDGMVDEARISNVARSADWITADYNNQKSNSTMVVFGPAQSAAVLSNKVTRVSILNSRLSNGTISTSLKVLVVAGGGAGGGSLNNFGAGGGAGGVVYDSSHPVTAQAYTVTVGGGGAANSNTGGSNGSNSTFDTITANGGGGGGSNPGGPNAGLAGGSGGGSASPTVLSGGLANQTNSGGGIGFGNNGGGVPNSNQGAGGGGGAGTVGADSTATTGGNGGNGTSNSITGSAVTYGGGGGGSSSGTPGTGGSGGGGAGQLYSGSGGSVGSSNTGGGGGGASVSTGSGGFAGGSGIIIISAPIGTVTATGGSHTTSGGNDIWTFTSSGTWTVTSVLGSANAYSRVSVTGN